MRAVDMPKARIGRVRHLTGHLPHGSSHGSAAGVIGDVLGNSPFMAQGSIRVAIARDPSQLEACASLIAKRYGWRGYDVPEPIVDNPSYFTIFAANPEGQVLGTLTLGLDSAAGLMADEMYKTEVDLARSGGGRVAELVRLAVEVCPDAKEVLASLLHMAYLCGRVIHGVTDAFIEVNPRHVTYYKRLFGFEVSGTPKTCPRVNAPAVLLRLRLERIHQAAHDFVEAVFQQLERQGNESHPHEEICAP
ncbi:MAG: hypothetical protein PHU46_15400 [Rhodocyclaceae bacterium]|nr:hypothetical protein [Rhodocyclaceae bacterium]